MATIGKLAVQITADTAGLSSGLASAGRQTDAFGGRLDALTSKLKILGPAAIAAGGAFAIGMVKSVANTADELAKLSARTGVAVEDLSRLQYAANLSGVSSQAMTTSIERLSRSMADAATGTGRAAESFQQLGISVKNEDGTLKSQRDILEEIAERFTGMEDGARKSALAQEVLGRSGTQLIPLLNGGAQGLRDMADESDRLGNTMSTATAQAAERFNDNITRMTTLAGGLARELAGPVIQSLADLTDRMIEATRAGRGFLGVLSSIFESSVGNRKILEQAAQDIERINQAISVMLITSNGRLSPAQQLDLQALSVELEKAIANYDALKAAQQDAADSTRVGGRDGFTETQEKLSTLGQFLDDLDQKFADAASERETKYLEGLQTRLLALQESVKTEEEIMMERHAKELADLEEILQEKIATEQEYMLLRQDLEHKHMEELGNIRERAYQDDQRRTQQWAQFEVQQRTAVANAAIGLLSQLGSKSKAAAIAAIALGKALSIAQIVQNTAVAQMRALAELGPIAGAAASARIGALGRIQAGIVAATGLVQAASVGGGGGSASLASGAAIQGAATGASAAGSVGGVAGAGRGQTVTINLQGETFGRDSVRNLITEINEAISEGAVLRLA